jgi:hypothetical protein
MALTRRWAAFFWAMAPIAAKYAARGDTRRAIAQTTLLSRALISLWRLIDEVHGPDPWLPDANRPLEAQYDARLPKPGAALSPKRVLNLISQLCDEAAELQARLADFDAGPVLIGEMKL